MSKTKTMDGNEAAAHASYAFTEVATIFPITPSSTMAELADEWAAHGRKNIFGQTVKVVEMQSEAGAAGAVHGSLQAGVLTTTYTASQGLLLMIPNMYKIAGELLPCVFHVSARALATHALSIFGDHQDVMSVRSTGFAQLSSHNVQEALDMGFIAHLVTVKSRIPFLHFFDGFRTSHEIQKIDVPEYEEVAKLLDMEAVQAFRDRSLNPEHPVLRGTAQNPDIYFQGREASNRFYAAVPDLVEQSMQEYKELTGREYHPFQYYGAEDAEYVIVAMGSICDTIEETIDYLVAKGEKVGVVKVYLYRPFSSDYFFKVLPKTVKKIAVLDRTKEPGAIGEPLYLDINAIFYTSDIRPVIVGGRYGLGSKDTTPSQVLSVYKNLQLDEPINGFTIGIVDDVTYKSLAEDEIIETAPEGTISCKLWGLGADGTVGANKQAIKIIGDHTKLYAQAYFQYDSKKSGGITVSHLRFGKKPIKSPYLTLSANYIACHNQSYVYQYDLLKGVKKSGNFVLNCQWTVDELEEKLPASMKQSIAKNKVNFYIIDAVSIARQIGLGSRINMIMQAAFFKLANVIPVEEAVDYLKESVIKTYGNKGQNIVDMNIAAIEHGVSSLIKVEIPADWENADNTQAQAAAAVEEPDFVKNILRPMNALEGDRLPVSAFLGREDGTFPVGTACFEKRGIAVTVPEWQIDKCIQCNQCSYICPHAAIRPFLMNEAEKLESYYVSAHFKINKLREKLVDEELNKKEKNIPETFTTKRAAGKGAEGLHFRMQVSALDCTGCGNCAEICPAKDKALIMKPAAEQIEQQTENWKFAMTLTNKSKLFDVTTVKGSQFAQPLLEFNGACPGCGETPYIKLITQLFGDRMMIANATGCSSIWGGSAPAVPYTTNQEGKGPSWANSLFEDTAEFGYGMYLGVRQLREKLVDLLNQALEMEISTELKEAFQEWLTGWDDAEASKAASAKILAELKGYVGDNKVLKEIIALKDNLIKKSQWILGGDGWAYDIGFGGLDHVLASGDDVNIFVMDTEVYSNTGGQSSKSTPRAAVAKFAAAGKKIRKKDLGMMAMSYGYVYVAQIALGANMAQTIKVIKEAEAYKGPSLIIAYSPCISHGLKAGMTMSLQEAKKAVDSGYWHLYHFNPDLIEEGKNPFTLDSEKPTTPFREFIMGEVRYSSLLNTFPESAEELFEGAEKYAKVRYDSYKRLTNQNWD
ncbi:pyruvate:ferredoxin (flavodoxin) oxidoreductase [Desulfosporosinus sp.]|uniref:pyruvate:ferredoxin (flavodoxin) oxidoreductase n=1 Tax=Desulfosporosinus sp. TaxID=157907 RepID=UPI0025C2D412|nr:pyruvate:ferredoxin (flavodoxin) oxidoreductase [Desulfosporosinus sp.]MBC2724099.1 pyruvate:ferredoxin (flavodoxin) oxidoreductase [Desulfosporosinus sp.]MBC2727279.1 pyruvate:ferredoxin (flavodoxin) oxidoreductase [Desulfosporosinus sp.]